MKCDIVCKGGPYVILLGNVYDIIFLLLGTVCNIEGRHLLDVGHYFAKDAYICILYDA